jgi:asparagine synthase (glutamine-hydrolysing)
MIAILGKHARPNEALARKTLATTPHPAECVTLRTLGNCVLGVANGADFVDSAISSAGDMIAAVSGRLDNASELHRSLTASGTAPASKSDADIVVAAFRTFGTEAPNRMRGAFAGIVTDGRNVWCFRDHIGFRPLFYRDDPTAFVAASESRQVAVGAQIAEEPDLKVVEQIFFGHMPSDMPAALKGVSRLAQATTLTVSGEKGVSLRQYWHPIELVESARLGADDIRDRFLELLAQAAARSLVGNDLILLSGGLDSPAVAAFAAPEHLRRTGRPLGALSAVFPHLPSVDERHYTELVAERFGIDLHTFRLSARALDDVDEWCRRFACPIPTLSYPELSESYKLARQLGYRNVISGEFAEFVFASPMHLVQHLLTHGRLRALTKLLIVEHRRGDSVPRLTARLLATFVPGGLANRYFHWRRLDIPERIPEWIDARRVNERPYRQDFVPPSWQRWRRLQVGGTHGATVMGEADVTCATMAGVTNRRPLADIDLWEFFLSIPAEVKFPDLRYKTLPRAMLRGVLPDEIIDRKRKTVFDDHVMAQVDYPTLRRLLVEPRHRIPAVDYTRLAQRIERQDFKRFDWFWAKDLARAHAFLNAW